jgi:phosphate:Na+ symporter
MHIMSVSMHPLRSFQPFIDLIIKIENPLFGLLIGTCFTALIQSSSAFIGIIIILAGQGFISLAGSIPLLLGANIGTAITAILASIDASRESKQVALAHTLFKVIGVLLLIWWIPDFVRLIEVISLKNPLPAESVNALSERLPRQIANAHTVFNIILAGIFLPFTVSFAKIVNKIIPCKVEELFRPKAKYLDENLINTPSLAMSEAKQEFLRMINIIRKMTRDIIIPFMEKNIEILIKIEQRGEEINFLRDEINTYLLKIAREKINSKMAGEIYQMMFAVKEFVQIGDIISTTLKQNAVNWCNDKSDFSAKGKREITEYHSITVKQITRAYDLYKEFDLKKAKKMKFKYEEYRSRSIELEKQHYKRLKKEVDKSVESSKTHLELMTMLKLINSHATNTARILLQ